MADNEKRGIRSYFSSSSLQISNIASSSINVHMNDGSANKEDLFDSLVGGGDEDAVNDDQEQIRNSVEENVEQEKNKKGKKRQRSNWAAGRNFLPEWAEKHTWIEPIPSLHGGLPTRARCIPCSWKQKTNCEMQLKIDTIEKHMGKLYEKKVIDGKEVNVVTWKEKCKHKTNVILFEQHKQTEKQKVENAASIRLMFQKMLDKSLGAKLVQLQTVFHVLKLGRPMTDYPEYKRFLSLQGISNFPDSHWSRNSGWEFAKVMNQIMQDDLRDIIKASDYFSLSLDEASSKDNSSWVCMTVYYVKEHVRRSAYVGVRKLMQDANAENIYEIVKETLVGQLELSMGEIARKLVCVGVDGASVMQGNRNGLCVRIQTGMAPYMLGIHCMAHRMDLAYQIVDQFKCVEKVENLVTKAYAFFSRSSKRYRLFKDISAGLTKGNKMLKNVSTRWISLYYPAERIFNEYPALVALMDKICVKKTKETEKALELLTILTDTETLLTLAGMLPMLLQMHMLVKLAEKETMYISEYSNIRKLSCHALECLYTTAPTVPYNREKFPSWYKLVEIESTNSKSFLAYDSKDKVCVKAHSRLVQMYTTRTRVRGRLPGRSPTSRDAFNNTMDVVRGNLAQVAKALAAEIRSRFPKDDFLEAMAIVYPQFWLHSQGIENAQLQFKKNLKIIIKHFAHTTAMNGEEIYGIISGEELLAQSECFGSTMWAQVENLEKPTKCGAITRLWTKIGYSQVLREHMPAYFKLADLCQTMILGSAEDERTFSLMGVLKNKVRNKLTKNLDLCLRAYASEYTIEEFPYERALATWSSLCSRRGQDKSLQIGEVQSTGWQA